MRIGYGLIRFLIPLAVLYTIGYYVPGFSALTVGWIMMLSVLIMAGDWAMEKIFPMEFLGGFQKGVISFLVSTVVIFTVTLALQYGSVPLSGALLAGLIIGGLMTLVPDWRQVTSGEQEERI